MKGLVIWAHSTCRSTLAFFHGLALAFDVPYEFYVLRKESNLRAKTGFCDDEFSHLNIKYPGSYNEALAILHQRKDWNHLFGCYQEKGVYQNLMIDAHKLGCTIGIASEAPCNMDAWPRNILKQIYINCVLPIRLRKFTQISDFIINFSGSENWRMKQVGWDDKKIIPCGYYSPAIPNSRLIRRTVHNWENFTILLSGIHKVHRSPMVLLKALHILDNRGFRYECYITQEGPLLEKMKQFAKSHNMKSVHFLGFIPMEKLISLYENCSVFIGAGNKEPWGMRLNDALQCGSPLIINRGMGGFKLVDDYGCGINFEKGNYMQLVDALEKMITDRNCYINYANKAYEAAESTRPENKAKEIASYIASRYDRWK